MILRLDVDHACFNKWLSYFRLTTGLQIPFFLDHVFETREFLKNKPVDRIWMFRARTCPESWMELHGLHVTSPETFSWEVNYVEKRLGEVKYFSRHGLAPFASGRLWNKKEIEFVQSEYNVLDISDVQHLTVSRLKDDPEKVNLHGIEQVLFHPIYIKSHGRTLEILLRRLRELNE